MSLLELTRKIKAVTIGNLSGEYTEEVYLLSHLIYTWVFPYYWVFNGSITCRNHPLFTQWSQWSTLWENHLSGQGSTGLIAPHCTKWPFNSREDAMQLQGTWHHGEHFTHLEGTYRGWTDNDSLVPLHTNASPRFYAVNLLLNLSLEEWVIFAHFTIFQKAKGILRKIKL